MIVTDDRDAYLLISKMLRLFDVWNTNRSVTRSGEELGWSQPTVSTWLGKLRQYLGDPLFVCQPRPACSRHLAPICSSPPAGPHWFPCAACQPMTPFSTRPPPGEPSAWA